VQLVEKVAVPAESIAHPEPASMANALVHRHRNVMSAMTASLAVANFINKKKKQRRDDVKSKK